MSRRGDRGVMNCRGRENCNCYGPCKVGPAAYLSLDTSVTPASFVLPRESLHPERRNRSKDVDVLFFLVPFPFSHVYCTLCSYYKSL